MTEHAPTETQSQLRRAFDEMIEALQSARDAIDSPDLHPPPATERHLAEGYRYVMGFLLAGIERSLADPLYPRFRRSIQPMNRATIDNSDAVYLGAEIDGHFTYIVRGRAADFRHWRGEAPCSGRRAPQYVIFELASGCAGDSGSLTELIPGTRVNTATLDSGALQLEADGSFEILIAPERPEGHTGNFMSSFRESRGQAYYGNYLSCRELFHDWAQEDLLDLEILRVGCESQPQPCFSAAAAVEMMKQVGEITRNQVHFWNAFYTVTLGTYGQLEGSLEDESGQGRNFMPVNDMNAPNALGIATGGGQSTNIYAGGTYLLEENEALIIEVVVPLQPLFMGFHLSNLWGESLNFESYQSSLNQHSLEIDEDGCYRLVVAHSDPGVPNWIDTTGLPHGFTTFRWTYEEQPDKSLWPQLKVEKVLVDDLRSHLPQSTRAVSAGERQQAILTRHRHVQRRYRQY